MIFEVSVHLIDQLGIVCTCRIQPEDCGRTCGTGAINSEFDPVTDRRVLHLAGAPDITLLYAVLQQQTAIRIHHTDLACSGNFKSLIMRSVFFGFLRHEANIGYCPHSRRIESTVHYAKIDSLGIHACITTIRDDEVRILLFTGLVPHLT